MHVLAAAVLGGASPALAASVEFYDVEARFDPATAQLPCVVQSTPKLSCNQLTVAIKFRNLGDVTSPENRVSLNQYNGTRAGGYAVRFGGSGALETLPALAPGQEVTLSWSASRVPAGTYTFQPKYSSPLNDANNRNHVITHTYHVVASPGSAPAGGSSTPAASTGVAVSSSSGAFAGSVSSPTVAWVGVSAPAGGSSPGTGPVSGVVGSSAGGAGSGGAFDVAATFVPSAGALTCQTEVNAAGQPQCVALAVQIGFTNVGGAASPQRKVSLNQFNGDRATGYAQRFGGSGAFQTLPELAPGKSVTLSWSAQAVPLSRYTFRPVYSGPLNDADNGNHAITATFDVVAP